MQTSIQADNTPMDVSIDRLLCNYYHYSDIPLEHSAKVHVPTLPYLMMLSSASPFLVGREGSLGIR